MAAKFILRQSKSPLSLLRNSNFYTPVKTTNVFTRALQNLAVSNRSPRSEGLDFSNSAHLLGGFRSGIGKLGGFVSSNLAKELKFSSAAGKKTLVVDEEDDEDGSDPEDFDSEEFVDEDDMDFDEEDDSEDEEVIRKQQRK